MRKGYSLIGVLIVVIIVSILSIGAIPSFNRIIRRAEMKEVKDMVDSVRAGARQFVLKRGAIGILSITAPDYWDQLNVDVDTNAVCAYTIVSGGTTTRQLRVESSGLLLYTYDLPNGPGTLNAGNPDARYVQDLP